MVRLAVHSSIQDVAAILQAAAVLGPDGWGGRPSHDRNRMNQSAEPNLPRDLLDLFSLLRDRKVRYLLVGGVAMLRYVEGRNTEDIDLVLSPKSLAALPEIVVGDQDRDFARGNFRGVRIDVLLTTNTLFRLVAQKHATIHRFREIDVRCATVDGLLLLKLYALPPLYRRGDGQRIALYEADMTMLMQRHRPLMDPIFKVLESRLDPCALAELRSIVADIEQRIARMDQAKR